MTLIILAGCAAPEQPPLGPTGNPSREVSPSNMRESYLIPPEIPASLLTYLFDSTAREREITSIRVKDVAENIWTLEITSESLPDSALRSVHRFALDGTTWCQV